MKILSARSLMAPVGWAVVGCLLATAAPVAVASPQLRRSATQRECSTSGKTIRSNAVARVFRVPVRAGHIYYGCMRQTGRVFRLDRTRRGVVFLEIPRLTGGYFAAQVWHIDSHEGGVTLWDLSTGTSSLWATGAEEFVEGDIAVTANGAVAWIDEGLDVWKADADGRAVIGSTDFRPKQWKALTLTGDSVSWRHKGVMHSYILRGGATDAPAPSAASRFTVAFEADPIADDDPPR